VEIGDGPAAVTGDKGRRYVTDQGLGRRGWRMIRKSEYLPETWKPLSADLKVGGDTWIHQGIPGSFFDPGIFFCSVLRSNY
jgi:hypothetical protein